MQVQKLASNAIDKFERKANGKGAVSAGNRFTLFISNEDMNDFIKTIKSLENSKVCKNIEMFLNINIKYQCKIIGMN